MSQEKQAIPSALAGQIQKTDLGKLHHVETAEKQVLPDQQCIQGEKTHQALLENIAAGDRNLKHTETQEKNVLPNAETIKTEKVQQDVMKGIEGFSPEQLKHSETQEKNTLPTKEVIAQEKASS